MSDQIEQDAEARAQKMLEEIAEQRRQSAASAAETTPWRSYGEPREPAEPAVFPAGFWARLDYLLQHPNNIVESIRRDHDLPAIGRILFTSALFMAAVYGAVMGATDLLQGAPNLLIQQKLAMIAISAIKVPILFLLTLGIVIPPIYVSNAFVGGRMSFRQILALLLTTTAITTAILASMATVACFFALTSRSYHFIKLLHVLFFVYAGMTGAGFLERTTDVVATESRYTSHKLRLVWLLLYAFVGIQLAWVMRPYVGSPGEKFQIFRERDGNFYESVADSVGRLLNGDKDPHKLGQWKD